MLCVCVCVCVCVRVCVHARRFHVNVFMHTNVHTYMCVLACMCVHGIHTRACVDVCNSARHAHACPLGLRTSVRKCTKTNCDACLCKPMHTCAYLDCENHIPCHVIYVLLENQSSAVDPVWLRCYHVPAQRMRVHH
jgi:hypothetical protein